MAPTATDYLQGLRRMWWLPVVALLAGLGLGLWAGGGAQPTAMTTGHAIFTFRIDDPGKDSAGSARGAEAAVAQARLGAYVDVARGSQEVRDILRAAGIQAPPSASSTTGGFEDGAARVLIDVTNTGVVMTEVKNGEFSQEEASDLAKDLAREVARQTIAADSRQETPSLSPDVIFMTPQATEQPASRGMLFVFPVFLLLSLGLGAVYVIVWSQGRIYVRRDIEERLGARVLGDISGRPADSPAIALALGKGREKGTRALLVPASYVHSEGFTSVGSSVAQGGRDAGLEVILEPVGATRVLQGSGSHIGAAPDAAKPDESRSASLTLIDSPAGLTADSLRSAASVDIVALIVEYGKTSYRDLEAAGKTLAEVSDAEIAVIGLRPTGITSS